MGDTEAAVYLRLERWDTVSVALRLTTGGRVAPAEVPRLCADLEELLTECPTAEVPLDVGTLTAPDLVSVDALARMQLTARRRGHDLVLRAPGRLLTLLLTATGLGTELGLPPERQTEQGEEPGGVQEDVEPGDPAV